jgi:hypothetical protein
MPWMNLYEVKGIVDGSAVDCMVRGVSDVPAPVCVVVPQDLGIREATGVAEKALKGRYAQNVISSERSKEEIEKSVKCVDVTSIILKGQVWVS